MGTHIGRVGAVLSAVGWLGERYGHLMSWKDPVSTFVIMLLFIYCCLFVQAEYALSVPLFIVVILFTESWMNRHFGHYRAHLVTPVEDPLAAYKYRPLSYLRLAVSRGVPKTPPPHMTLSFLPEGPVGNVHLATLDGKSTYHLSTSSSSSNAPKNGGDVAEDPHPELQIASFFIPSNLLGAQDVPLPQGRGVHQPLSSNLAGEAITSLMTSLNIVKEEQVLNDSLLHNVSVPWRRQGGEVGALLTEALMKSDSNTLGVDSSNGKSSNEPDPLRQKKIASYLEEPDVSYVYPVLQKPRPPSAAISDKDKHKAFQQHKRCTTKPSSKSTLSTQFEPWSTSPAVLKYTLRGSSSGVGGQMMDNTWGYIYVPLSAVARAMAERRVEKQKEKHMKEIERRAHGYFEYWRTLFGSKEQAVGDGEWEGEGEEVCVWCDVQWTPSFSQTFASSSSSSSSSGYSENIGDLDNPYSVMRGRSETSLDDEKDEQEDPEEDDEGDRASSISVQPTATATASVSASTSSPARGKKVKSNTRNGSGSGSALGAQVLLRVRLDRTIPAVATGGEGEEEEEAVRRHWDESPAATSNFAPAIETIPGVSSREVELSR